MDSEELYIAFSVYPPTQIDVLTYDGILDAASYEMSAIEVVAEGRIVVEDGASFLVLDMTGQKLELTTDEPAAARVRLHGTVPGWEDEDERIEPTEIETLTAPVDPAQP